jgi:hypothetical protein
VIRARNALRPDAACHSSDVLTSVERSAEHAIRGTKQWLRKQSEPKRDPARPMKWGDVPEIRAILLSLLRVRR